MRNTETSPMPLAVLHDHLDGGLRIATLLELADESGAELPTRDPSQLEDVMHQGRSGSLVDYLAAFDYTIAVMQTTSAIERVAYEAAIDHYNAGVAYAEVRLDPTLLTRKGLRREDVLEAVLAGLARAQDEVDIALYVIATALRNQPGSLDVARAAARFVGEGVVGFDLAGPEIGFPPHHHLPAINHAREHGLGITLHAGEADGVHSIGAALGKCGAARIGHGVRIIEDCKVVDGQIVGLGAVARKVRDHRIPLEVSVSSNVHTGVSADIARHPIGTLYRAGFNVTINTDNRLMSGVSMATEVEAIAQYHGFNEVDIANVTIAALRAGFGSWPTRNAIIDRISHGSAAGAR